MKAPVLGLLVATAAFGASSIYLWQQLQDERARAAQVEETSRQLTARIAELEKARTQFTAQRAPDSGGFISGRLSSATAPAAAQPAPETKTEGGPAQPLWTMSRQEPSPAFRKMMRSQIRANNKRIYADVGEKLGLSRDATARLIDLLSEQQTSNMDMASPTEDPTLARQRFEQTQRDNENAISDLIGPDKAQSLKEYQASLPARMEVDMLARQLEGNDVTLSTDQRKKLVDVYVAERARVPQPEFVEGMDGEAYAKSMSAWQEDYNGRISAEASRVLNSDQLTAYNEIQQWQKEMRAQFANAPGGRMFRMRGMPGGAANVTFSTAMPVGVSATVVNAAPAPAQEQKKP